MSANTRFPVAVHVMTALACRDGENLTSPYLAHSIQTHPVVVRRTLGQLRKAGLVEGHAGKSGGTRLARSPERITLLDIYAAVGGSSVFALPDKPEVKTCAVSCGIKRLLADVQADADRAFSASLQKVRLSDMVQGIHEAGG